MKKEGGDLGFEQDRGCRAPDAMQPVPARVIIKGEFPVKSPCVVSDGVPSCVGAYIGDVSPIYDVSRI